MAKETAAHRKANYKYKKNRSRFVQLQYTISDFDVLEKYCKHINTPIATWIKTLILNAINSDSTFTYTSEEESPHED